MNFPTVLTAARLVAVVPVVWAFEVYPVGTRSIPGPWAWVAFGAFTLASITDWFDGYLARRWHQTSAIGSLLDPLADKVLVAAALVGLSARQVIPAWTVSLFLFREFLVTGLRVAIAENGAGIKAAAWSGKVKAATQMIAVVLYLWPGGGLKWPADLTFAVALVLTVSSGAEYVWQSRGIWNSTGRGRCK